MAGLRGERFAIDLPEGEDASQSNAGTTIPTLPVSNLIGDILERAVTDSSPPEPPSSDNHTGFPAHKDRTKLSKFKQARQQSQNGSESEERSSRSVSPRSVRPGESGGYSGNEEKSPEEQEKLQIDEENKQRLAAMSPEELDRQRQELLGSLNPEFIQQLLKRSTIDDDPKPRDWNFMLPERPKAPPKRPSSHTRKVSFAVPDAEEAPNPDQPTAERHSISFSSNASNASSDTEMSDYNRSPSRKSKRPSPSHRKVSFAVPDSEASDGEDKQTAKRHSISSETSSQSGDPDDPPRKYSLNPLDPSPPPSIHFPKPPPVDIDPESDTFLDDLHNKYFPNLAHDPSKLEWMKPADPSEDAAYDPCAEGVEPKDIRFSFQGNIIPPSLSHSLPTSLGLHHHGDAPSAAGYTIPELARLSRSAFPAQRCLSMQTLGRILYRLGMGEFGDETDIDTEGDAAERGRLAKGLWDAAEEGRCVDTLTEEANKTQGHQTSISIAQEALWLWQRGGGRKRKAV
jgi:RNA polymerase II-associated protein 1